MQFRHQGKEFAVALRPAEDVGELAERGQYRLDAPETGIGGQYRLLLRGGGTPLPFQTEHQADGLDVVPKMCLLVICHFLRARLKLHRPVPRTAGRSRG